MNHRARDGVTDTVSEGSAAAATTHTKLRAEGLTCPSCVATIERQLKRLPGVTSATVKFASGRIDVEHDLTKVTVADIERAIARAGYSAKAAAV